MSESIVYRQIPRPSADLIASLRGIAVADLHDEMSPIDRRCRLMAPSMRPLLPGRAVVGPAMTAFNTPGDNLMMHTALYLAERGDVLVVSNGGVPYGALWGGNATVQATQKGVVGIVIDGPARDTAQVRGHEGFGVWSTSVSVGKPGKEAPGSVNIPVLCGGVLVNPGDIVVADDDGVIVIDPQDVERLVRAARARMGRDEVMQASIHNGNTLFEQLSGLKQLEKVGAEIRDGHWRERRDPPAPL
jgi:4-hydroxy-4-methyl-2-oxoglutarate aldolase